MERDIKVKYGKTKFFYDESINPIIMGDDIKIPGQECGTTTLVKIALRKLSEEFDRFISECLNEGETIKQPSKQAIMRARGCLPPYCKNSFKKKDKK